MTLRSVGAQNLKTDRGQWLSFIRTHSRQIAAPMTNRNLFFDGPQCYLKRCVCVCVYVCVCSRGSPDTMPLIRTHALKRCRCGMKICPAWSAVRKTLTYM